MAILKRKQKTEESNKQKISAEERRSAIKSRLDEKNQNAEQSNPLMSSMPSNLTSVMSFIHGRNEEAKVRTLTQELIKDEKKFSQLTMEDLQSRLRQ